MERALITGITRTSKESLFSDMNNLDVANILSDKYSTAFGFTEQEVFLAMEARGLGDSESKEAGKNAEPERFYHGFVLGLLVDLQDQYMVRSNRESGFGRYDVMLIPKNVSDPAFILEFTVRNKKREASLEDTIKTALTQIQERQYKTELIQMGIPKENIIYYGFAFEGKEVLIQGDAYED